MSSPLAAFTREPRTRAQHLAVLLTLGGPLGPFNTPEDFEALREEIYGRLDRASFEALVDLIVRPPDAAERAPAEAEEVNGTLSECLAVAIGQDEERWECLRGLLNEASTREVALGAIALRGSPKAIPWLEELLARRPPLDLDRADLESILAGLT
jgi:hypothetical protein